MESIGSALKTHQSYTIKYRVTKIVPESHWEGHKGSTVLRSCTARRCKRVPMSNQITTSNTLRHIRQRQFTAQRKHWVTLRGMDHQKALKKKKCKFVTVMLFGKMSESFRKIVWIVFERHPLVWGWQGFRTKASIFFLVLIYRYPFIKIKKNTRTAPLIKSNYRQF